MTDQHKTHTTNNTPEIKPSHAGLSGQLSTPLKYDPNLYPNNPNGSVHGIAGVFSGDKGQFFGAMPHPERAIETFHFTEDGLFFFENILKNL